MTEYKLEDIERIKENFVPLQRGHKASVLSGLSSSSADQKQRIQSTRVQFEREIADLSDDHLDPLDVFYRFVKFVQEFMPADSSTLKKLLEKAVRKFRADERYKNDARNLHLWMLVAKGKRTHFSDTFFSLSIYLPSYIQSSSSSYLGAPDPREVFKYLSVHDIAQSFSLFYEEYASFLESRGE